MREIDAGRLALRPIGAETARALLSGQIPAQLVLAPDYPSQFSLEVMDLLVGPRSEGLHHFGPFFMVRRDDGAVIGEIGAFLELATRTAQVGYSVVASCWGKGMPQRHSKLSCVNWPSAKMWTGWSPRRW